MKTRTLIQLAASFATKSMTQLKEKYNQCYLGIQIADFKELKQMEANENVSQENVQLAESITSVLENETYGLTMLDLSARLDQQKAGVYPDTLVEVVKELVTDGVLVAGSLVYKRKGFCTVRKDTVMLSEFFNKNGK